MLFFLDSIAVTDPFRFHPKPEHLIKFINVATSKLEPLFFRVSTTSSIGFAFTA